MSIIDNEVIEQQGAIDGAAGDAHVTDHPATDVVAPERSETETRARAMGWVGKDEFRGPAEHWRDADEFVKRGEDELPILRERNKDMARKVAEFEERVARQEREFADRVGKIERMSTAALVRQREQITAEYEAAKRHAVADGDTQRYDQLSRDQGQAVRQFDEQYHQATAQPQRQQGPDLPPHVAAEVSVWTEQNQWFNSDPILNQYAQTVHMHLNQSKPGLALRDNLAEVAREVRQRFPEKFNMERRSSPTAVESGGGGLPSGGRRARGIADIPAEERRIGQEFVNAGAYKDMNEFAKSFWAQNGG